MDYAKIPNIAAEEYRHIILIIIEVASRPVKEAECPL
jgi:hypothetical protein